MEISLKVIQILKKKKNDRVNSYKFLNKCGLFKHNLNNELYF